MREALIIGDTRHCGAFHALLRAGHGPQARVSSEGGPLGCRSEIEPAVTAFVVDGEPA